MPTSSSAPPAWFGSKKPVRVLLGRDEPQPGLQVADLADLARGEHRRQLGEAGPAAHPHRLHEKDVSGARRPHELLGLGRLDREGLLAQHRPAHLDAVPDGSEMGGVARADVDDVDGVVLDEGVVGAVDRGDAVGRGEPPRRLLAAGPDGDDLAIRREADLVDERGRDLPGGEDPPAHRAVGRQRRGHRPPTSCWFERVSSTHRSQGRLGAQDGARGGTGPPRGPRPPLGAADPPGRAACRSGDEVVVGS